MAEIIKGQQVDMSKSYWMFLLVKCFPFFSYTLFILSPFLFTTPPCRPMSSSPPDISSLSISSRPSQQRLHDTYDYEGSSAARSQFHFATSPGIQHSPYSPLSASMNHSPLKNKPARSALPTVCVQIRWPFDISRLPSFFSNGLGIILQTVAHCPRKIPLISLPLAVLLPWVISILPSHLSRLDSKVSMRRLFQRPL